MRGGGGWGGGLQNISYILREWPSVESIVTDNIV